jgi:hypothetical protein
MMERVQNEEERLRVKVVMERWRKFFLGMQIKGRLDARHGKIEGVDDEIMVENEEDGGGFLHEDIQPAREFDPVVHYEPQFPRTTEVGQGHENSLRTTYMASSNDERGSRSTTTAKVDDSRLEDPVQNEGSRSASMRTEWKSPGSDVEMSGGGFIPEEESEGGGFLPPAEDSEEDDNSDDFVYEDEDGIL